MPASQRLNAKALLSPLMIVSVLAAPHAFAKKDLFGNEPGAKESQHFEQLVPNASSSAAFTDAPKEHAATTSVDTSAHPKEKAQTPAEPKADAEKAAEKSPSYLEKQFARFKSNLVETKDDLFGNNKKTSKKEPVAVPQPAEPALGENSNSSEESQIPTISAAEAAQRAQALAEGQVINVRKYQEDDKPRYAVKLLQKNGRMKTINLDAVSGALIEDSP